MAEAIAEMYLYNEGTGNVMQKTVDPMLTAAIEFEQIESELKTQLDSKNTQMETSERRIKYSDGTEAVITVTSKKTTSGVVSTYTKTMYDVDGKTPIWQIEMTSTSAGITFTSENGTQQKITKKEEFTTDDGITGVVYAKDIFDDEGNYLGTEEFIDYNADAGKNEVSKIFYKNPAIKFETGLKILNADVTDNSPLSQEELSSFLEKALVQNHCDALGRLKDLAINDVDGSILLKETTINGVKHYIYIENIVDNGDGTYTFDVVSSPNDKKTDTTKIGTVKINVKDEYGIIQQSDYKEIFENGVNENGNEYYPVISMEYNSDLETDPRFKWVYEDGTFIPTYDGKVVKIVYGSYFDIKNAQAKSYIERGYGKISPARIFVPQHIVIKDDSGKDVLISTEDLYKYSQDRESVNIKFDNISHTSLDYLADKLLETGTFYDGDIVYSSNNVGVEVENDSEEKGVISVKTRQVNNEHFAESIALDATISHNKDGELEYNAEQQSLQKNNPLIKTLGMSYE